MFLTYIIVNLLIINFKYVKSDSDFDSIDLLENERVYDSASIETTDEQVYYNGTWLCGNCTDLKEAKIKYNESYDIEINGDNAEVQIGVSIPDMRCVTVTTDDTVNVQLVSGSCSGDSVTLSVYNTSHYDVNVY
ncbi:unnamed protein product [Pieris macdunnoughi]|uniref:Uncharacterized protein n=1 Tax=Pieris macdunnoughi TaxID=345717 RepID=A0A821UPM0_9NEOP|nr:unnamed protein product [Pieris macdunnoughi]